MSPENKLKLMISSYGLLALRGQKVLMVVSTVKCQISLLFGLLNNYLKLSLRPAFWLFKVGTHVLFFYQNWHSMSLNYCPWSNLQGMKNRLYLTRHYKSLFVRLYSPGLSFQIWQAENRTTYYGTAYHQP